METVEISGRALKYCNILPIGSGKRSGSRWRALPVVSSGGRRSAVRGVGDAYRSQDSVSQRCACGAGEQNEEGGECGEGREQVKRAGSEQAGRPDESLEQARRGADVGGGFGKRARGAGGTGKRVEAAGEQRRISTFKRKGGGGDRAGVQGQLRVSRPGKQRTGPRGDARGNCRDNRGSGRVAMFQFCRARRVWLDASIAEGTCNHPWPAVCWAMTVSAASYRLEVTVSALCFSRKASRRTSTA